MKFTRAQWEQLAALRAMLAALPTEYKGDVDQGTKGAYQDVGTSAANAQAINPLSGSRLYDESAGRIYPLFATINDDGTTIGTNNYGKTFAIGDRIKTSARGDAILWYTSTDQQGFTIFRLWKNGVVVMPWLPITRVGISAFGKPVSPFAGPDTRYFAVTTQFNTTTPLLAVSFDQVEVLQPSFAAAAVELQALIVVGRAGIGV